MTTRESHNSSQGVMTSLPNLLTYGRILAVPLMVGSFFLSGDQSRWIVFTIFIIAGITDFLDGYVARAWAQQSRWGQMLDPIADKLLVATSIVLLVAWDTITGIMLIPAIVILCREILVSGLREFLGTARVSLPVTLLAKWKTGIQMVALALLIAGPAADKFISFTSILGEAGIWVAALITIYTGFDYFKAGFRHASDEKTS
ncbi:MAG: CDP-diacylglycerol--glycerol-3-phosphate 3-phosphatidyltransferase [Alphaproteobacteria bacterium]|nr:MAG: CDP-diacylglycerol--glycerol-3-phosphate 3-phosphatidyltransferase [Alphaproteobacteria bacterium]